MSNLSYQASQVRIDDLLRVAADRRRLGATSRRLVMGATARRTRHVWAVLRPPIPNRARAA
jgi:hypothetical protein